MTHADYINHITQGLAACDDLDLLELILNILRLESGQ